MKRIKQKGDPECEICRGVGTLPIQEGDPEYENLVRIYGDQADAYVTVRRCICLERRRFRDKVGSAIYNAKPLSRDEHCILDELEKSNVFMQSNRSDFLAHFRDFLWRRDLNYYWKMTTDMDLVDIFLGKNEEWPSVSTFAKGPDLLVLLLGYQSYKNVALSGVIQECLKARQFVDKPTWVINPHELVFKQGQHLAWSPELEYFLADEYRSVYVKPNREVKAIQNGFGFEDAEAHGQAGQTNTGKGKGAAKHQGNFDLF